jgi:hypothetical protein
MFLQLQQSQRESGRTSDRILQQATAAARSSGIKLKRPKISRFPASPIHDRLLSH